MFNCLEAADVVPGRREWNDCAHAAADLGNSWDQGTKHIRQVVRLVQTKLRVWVLRSSPWYDIRKKLKACKSFSEVSKYGSMNANSEDSGSLVILPLNAVI